MNVQSCLSKNTYEEESHEILMFGKWQVKLFRLTNPPVNPPLFQNIGNHYLKSARNDRTGMQMSPHELNSFHYAISVNQVIFF